jgi:hypothetical protein
LEQLPFMVLDFEGLLVQKMSLTSPVFSLSLIEQQMPQVAS